MALKIFEKFSPRANPADSNYPYGSIKNESVPGAKDGTPLDASWGNDMGGFTDALLSEAGIVPSGTADTAIDSQRLDAVKKVSSLQAAVQLIEQWGYTYKGTFAKGFTYSQVGDVGVDSDFNVWAYVGTGAPNKVVSAGTVPSVSAGYEQVYLSGITIESIGDDFYGMSASEGVRVRSVGWHKKSGSYALKDPATRGGGFFIASSTVAKSAHNGGTVISPTVPPVSQQAGSTLSDRVAAFIRGEGETDPSGTGVFIRECEETIYTTWFGHRSDLENSAPCFQAAIDFSESNWEVVVPENALITESIVPRTRITIRGLTKQGQEIRGLIDGGLFERTSGQLWKNIFKNLTLNNEFDGVNAACIKATGYQMEVSDCSIRCDYGKGIHLLANDYCVENRVFNNYFFTCKNGIYAETGARSNTDAYVIDNYFFGGGVQESSIYWNISSGSVFRGNHFYGGCSRYFMEMVGGINVSILDNYFEGNNSRTPRLFIAPGNTGSWTITGNKFWLGDGSGSVNAFGESESIIKIEFTAGIRQEMCLVANIFEGGVNNVDVIRTNISINNSAHSVNKIRMNGNMYSGSYSLGVNTSRIVELERGEFEFIHTDRSPTVGIASTVERYTNESFAESFVNLPNNTLLRGKSFELINESSATTINFNTNLPIIGKTSLAPNDKVVVTMRDSTYYIF